MRSLISNVPDPVLGFAAMTLGEIFEIIELGYGLTPRADEKRRPVEAGQLAKQGLPMYQVMKKGLVVVRAKPAGYCVGGCALDPEHRETSLLVLDNHIFQVIAVTAMFLVFPSSQS